MSRAIRNTTVIFKNIFSPFLVCFLTALHAQSPSNHHANFSQSFAIDISSQCNWAFENNFVIEKTRVWTTWSITRNLRLVSALESRTTPAAKWTKWDEQDRVLPQYYAQFNSTSKLLLSSLIIDARIGKLEWFPDLTDPVLINENIQLFLQPYSFYGGSLRIDGSLRPDMRLHLGMHSGDLLKNGAKATLHDAWLEYRPFLFAGFYLNTRAGRFQTSRYFIQQASLEYQRSFGGNLVLSGRAGKLAGYDDTPWGIHLDLRRTFRYIELGGYWEKRLEQTRNNRILGFYWRLVSPPKLVEIMSAYQFIYDTNTNALRMNIPLVSINFHF